MGPFVSAGEMESVMSSGVLANPYPMGATKSQVWGISFIDIVRKVADLAREFGREYRTQIEGVGRAGIDLLAAMDLPFIPDSIEGVIDEKTKQLGYAAIKSLLDAAFAE